MLNNWYPIRKIMRKGSIFYSSKWCFKDFGLKQWAEWAVIEEKLEFENIKDSQVRMMDWTNWFQPEVFGSETLRSTLSSCWWELVDDYPASRPLHTWGASCMRLRSPVHIINSKCVFILRNVLEKMFNNQLHRAKKKKAKICIIYQFSQCKYCHHDWFQVVLTPLW